MHQNDTISLAVSTICWMKIKEKYREIKKKKKKLTFSGDEATLTGELSSPDKNKWQLLYLPFSLDIALKSFSSLPFSWEGPRSLSFQRREWINKKVTNLTVLRDFQSWITNINLVSGNWINYKTIHMTLKLKTTSTVNCPLSWRHYIHVKMDNIHQAITRTHT